MTDETPKTDETPTTMNGLLHTPDANLDDRLIRATYATPQAADAARQLLMQNGIAGDRISIVQNATDSMDAQAAVQPEDSGVLARVREALLPDDGKKATIDAVNSGQAILELRPTKDEVDTAVSLIESSNPSHFDARLQRWRNSA